MNKKCFVVFLGALFIFVGLFVFNPSTVQAQEQEAGSIGEVFEPGLLADSPLYFLKGWGRAFRLFFAFNPLEKAKLELKFANEDVLAVKDLCGEKGKCELARKHYEQFHYHFQKALQRMEKAKRKGKDIEELVEKLKENHLHQQQVLADVLEKVPEQAQEGILKAIENSSRGLEKAIEEVQGEDKKNQYQEQLHLQIQNMGEEAQLKIRKRLERGNQRQEESPVGEPQQKQSSQQEAQGENSNQQEPTQKIPGGKGKQGE